MHIVTGQYDNTPEPPTAFAAAQQAARYAGVVGAVHYWTHHPDQAKRTDSDRLAAIIGILDDFLDTPAGRQLFVDELPPPAAAGRRRHHGHLDAPRSRWRRTMTARATAAQALTCIANGLDAGLAQPVDVGLHSPATGYSAHSLDIRLDDNAAADLPGWIEWLGLGEIKQSSLLGGADRPQWRAHQATGEWQGWDAEVWSAVDEPKPEGGES